MLQPWKQIVACGVLILTGLGTPGLLNPLQVSTPQRRFPQLSPKGGAGEDYPQPAVQSFELLKEVGRPHRLAPNARHDYRVDLKANQCLRAAVHQGIDVQVKLEGPAGETLLVIDTPRGDEGEEPILLVAGRSGPYRMTVSADGEHPLDKTYAIKFAKVGPSTLKDRRQAAALHSYYTARDRIAINEGRTLRGYSKLSRQPRVPWTGPLCRKNCAPTPGRSLGFFIRMKICGRRLSRLTGKRRHSFVAGV